MPQLSCFSGISVALFWNEGVHAVPAAPAWYLDLKANPRTTVEIGRGRIDVIAQEAPEEDRGRLWAPALSNYPHFDAYQERTHRRIPVVVLKPVWFDRAT